MPDTRALKLCLSLWELEQSTGSSPFPRFIRSVITLMPGILQYGPNCIQPDTFGSRNLVLVGCPLMSLCLIFTGSSFFIPPVQAHLACVAVGMYLFMV